MYLDFYGLREQPFSATPDPKFLFLTPGHREALAQLIYGVQESKGFIVLTGEVGTGKTTLLRALMERIGTSTHVAFIFDSTMPFDGLLEYMLEDFGIPSPGQDARPAPLRAEPLPDRAPARRSDGRGHRRRGAESLTREPRAPPVALELRDADGQAPADHPRGPARAARQARPPGAPPAPAARRACAARSGHSPPRRRASYIRSRLHVAGASDTRLFTDAAVDRIAAYTNGIPRLVNILCDHCLLIGYTEQTRRVERAMVERGIEYLEDGQRPAHARGMFWRPATRRLTVARGRSSAPRRSPGSPSWQRPPAASPRPA